MTAALTLALGAAPAFADHEPPEPWPLHDRIYLAMGDDDQTYWTVDPSDPELSRTTLTQYCGPTESWRVTDDRKPCFYGGNAATGYFYTAWFGPGSLFETQPGWTSADPLRYHVEIDVDALDDYTISLVLQSGAAYHETPPATEVAPGVFEGTMTPPYTLHADDYTYFGVRVNTTSSRLVTELALRGRSWIQFPEAVGAKAVSDLIREDTYRPSPTSYEGETRSLWFNDDDWEAWSFSGDTAEPRTMEVSFDRAPTAVVAWVESYDQPFVQDVLRGGDPDSRRLHNGVWIGAYRGGEEVEHSAGPYNGQGTAGFSSVTMAAGEHTIEVTDLGGFSDPLEFDAHVVAIYGERTLGAMQWSTNADWMFQLPVIASCPYPVEQVPQTAEVRSVAIDLDADSDAAGLPAFTLSYDIPTVGSMPCGEDSGKGSVRFTYPGERVWWVGATIARHGAFVSAYDTTFEFEARYTYSPPPKEHEEG